ncbi:hypothetical protein [Carbonactinospora thermoautotrophica]|uniref:hypothetical protein n=1 Tax=Carbonactinospora thermoautotrophica TaxID=1469144 RepID=UPI000B08897E|nr:hypothetical protein [Carbonactinospora thermoautotrophica]
MFWRRQRPSLPDCYLVYARRGHEGDEPLVEVVATEEEALAIDAMVRERYPELEIRWETVPWHRAKESLEVNGHVVHVVFTGAPDNVIGLAAFDDRDAADRIVEEGRARGDDLHRRTVTMGQWLNDEFPLNKNG